MPFRNRVRLPFHLRHPQFPEEANLFRLANGETKVQSIVIRKVYEGVTDHIPEQWHQKLTIALSHDIVNIEGNKYFGGVRKDGEYNIEWQEWLSYDLAQAKFKVAVSPFDATNSNCQTCEEAAQVDLSDRTFPDDLEEGQEYEINVLDGGNTPCCHPYTVEIITFNAAYLESATIDEDGLITIVTKDEMPTANEVSLVTYRVTCPNGGYDEGVVKGNTSGSGVSCLEPSNIQGTATATSVPLSWDPPSPAPAGYYWEIKKCSAPGIVVQSGNTTDPEVTINGLEADTCYNFYVQSDCGGGSTSGFITAQFETLNDNEFCGMYSVTYSDGSLDPTAGGFITWLNCNSEYQSMFVFNFTNRTLCALQHSPGSPVDIINAASITYVEPC